MSVDLKEPKAGQESSLAHALSDPVINIALDTIQDKQRQLIVFVNTKRGAESQAEKIAHKLQTNHELTQLSEKILKVLSSPTKQCKRLAMCVSKGSAFHHAGLPNKQRELIEDAFKEKIIKSICATPTLCLHKDSLVWSGVSERQVSSLKRGARIIGIKNNECKPKKVVEVHEKTNKLGFVKINTVSGYELKITPNHRIPIKRDGKRMLIQAGDCVVGDRVATLANLKIEGKNRLFSDFVVENKIPFKDFQLDTNDCYVIGCMLGDGYSGATIDNEDIIYKGSPCIVGEDFEVFEKVIDFCEFHGFTYRRQNNFHGTPSIILSKTKVLREFLCRTGVDTWEKKHISSKLLGLPLDQLAALLRGLFDTDGFVERGRNIGYSSISINLIKGMQKALLRFGIVTRLRERKASTMKIYEKEYKTKKSFEITILQNDSIRKFYHLIGFNILRKQKSLIELVDSIESNVLFFSCKQCDYHINGNIFSGRTRHQKLWADQKKSIISLLGEKKELGSNDLQKQLGFLPRKKENRINLHYCLINKRKIGAISKTEWFWSLNPIGLFVYESIIKKGDSLTDFLQEANKCPLCDRIVQKTIRKNWRTQDFDGDIFWDCVRSTTFLLSDSVIVYDVELPSSNDHDHLFVTDGIFVHNSAGVDLPAFRVVIRDLKRYGGPWGMSDIPVLEYEQMSGRAGRPGKDPWGEAICIAKDEKSAEEISEKYINGDPEEIYSKLAVEPVLRTYVLSLVASNFVKDKKELEDFFATTFYAHQYGDKDKLNSILDRVINLLREWEFLKGDAYTPSDDFQSASELTSDNDDKLEATLLGKRVSELYLDPYTAHHLINGIKRAASKPSSAFSYIHLCASTLELRPYLRVKTSELELIDEKIALEGDSFLHIAPNQYSDEYDIYLDTIKTAMLFESWTQEESEEDILEKFAARPGELHAKLVNMDWIVYAATELCRLLSFHEQRGVFLKLRTRLKHGAKEELLPLLKLRNVGRVRARKLFRAGVKDVAGIKNIDPTSLAQLVGKAVSIKLKEQVGQKVAAIDLKVKENKRIGQISLHDF